MKSRQFLGAFLLLLALAAGCAKKTEPPKTCNVTADTTHTVNGYTLTGKRGGAVFFNMGQKDRTFTAKKPEKMLVFLDDLSRSGPRDLTVKGKNLDTGTTADFVNYEHGSEYGREWGANYTFPEPGCWQLSVDDGANKGSITVKVTN